ncbi:Alpha/Beta hydrolase protein [Coprinopsis sp. MPI-PUGE-AT-0042]|nr:Alpha/Beta hydrolase protein [Coprinopsis sp. MPI-PUGE-AT-0042]
MKLGWQEGENTPKRKLKYIIYALNKGLNEMIVESTSEDGSWSDFVHALPEKEPRWGVFDYRKEGLKNKILFIHWCPDDSMVRPRMAYSSSTAALQNTLDIATLIFASDAAELDEDTILKKNHNHLNLLLDVYPPAHRNRDNGSSDLPSDSDAVEPVPALIFFHGGGLTAGNRLSWFPEWLSRRFTKLGYLFISADYRLLPPSTGRDILDDLKDLWSFVTDPQLVLSFPSEKLSGVDRQFIILSEEIIVAGTSAGGLCAYLAASCDLSPPPMAVLSIYGMGGDFLTPHYLHEKRTPFFRGRELLDPAEFQEFLFPYDNGTPSVVSDSPLSYHPATYHIPGYPSNPRMLLTRLYLQMGTFLNYYTGLHSPSLSQRLHVIHNGAVTQQWEAKPDATRKVERAARPLLQAEGLLSLFPQFSVSKLWPKTVLLHGTADTAVPIGESRHLARLLRSAQVEVELIEVEGEEHSFDLAGNAEEKFGHLFNRIVKILHGGRF